VLRQCGNNTLMPRAETLVITSNADTRTCSSLASRIG
jgi:hypothetical protein